MSKSLTEVARQVLLKESDDAAPDRDAKKTNPNMETLKPKSKGAEGPIVNPGSTPPTGEVEDLGPAAVKQGDVVPSSKAADKLGKDTSASSQSARKTPPGESFGQGKTLSEDENFEISEELEAFIQECIDQGLSEEDTIAAIEENFELISEDDQQVDEDQVDEDQVDEDFEISEELEAFINEKIAEGLSEDEIAEAIEENFELVTEEQLQELSKNTLKDYIRTAIDDRDDRRTAIVGRITNRNIVSNAVPNVRHRHNRYNKIDHDKIVKRTKGINKALNKLEEEQLRERIDMTEHVNALLQGETLSEEFKEKAKTIFEAAIQEKFDTEVAILREQNEAQLEEKVQEITKELSENIDNYLAYVVEQWIQENEVAVEAGLRTELTEDFITGLRNLFAENYIDIPEDKVSVVEELSGKVQELQDKLNEEIEHNVQLNKVLAESKRQEIVVQETEGLTATQAEKLKSLTENVDFNSVNEFTAKVKTLRENYFPRTADTRKVLDNNESSDDPTKMLNENLDGPMAKYVQVIGKRLPK